MFLLQTKKSGKRDSDPRPRPWQGRALPTELFPRKKQFGEEEETRTPTKQFSLPPQSSASTNSATSPSCKALKKVCPEQDSNLHVAKHTHLKRARLPIPPPGQKTFKSHTLLFNKLSGKRDSDPRPRPWQGRALPTELFPRYPSHEEEHFSKCGAKVAHFFEPPKYFTTFFIINRFLFIRDHIASCHSG